jgi:penicillin-binding protein 2
VPRIVKAYDEGNGWQSVPAPKSPFQPFLMKPETISAVHDGLWMAVNAAGTAGRGRVAGRDVSGKTGTAQVISNQGKERARGNTDRDLRDHGWFVFMVPKDNPELAGVVFTEHGEHGYFSAQVARHIVETYYAQKEGKPLPPPPVPAAPVAPAPAVRTVATNGVAGEAR